MGTDSFRKSIARLIGSSFLAKVISISLTPILTRLYEPEDFGVYTAAMSIMTVCGGLISLRLCDAIPIAKSKRQARGITELSILISFFLAPVSYFFVSPFYNSSEVTFKYMEISIIIFGAILISVYETLTFYSVRKAEYKVISITQLQQSVAGGGVKVLGGLIGVSSIGLIFGSAFQQGFGIVYMLKKYKLFNSSLDVFCRKRLLLNYAIFRKYKEYPRFRLPSRTVLAISQALPIIYFTKEYGNESVGFLGLAMSMISIPATMIIGNVRKVYYGEISKIGLSESQRIMSLTLSIIMKMLGLAIVFSLILFLFAEQAFSVLFGDNWIEAGLYSKVLSIQVAANFVAGPIVDAFNVIGKVRYYFYFNLFKLILVATSLFFSSLFSLSEIDTLVFLSISVALYYIIQSICILTLIGRLGYKTYR